MKKDLKSSCFLLKHFLGFRGFFYLFSFLLGQLLSRVRVIFVMQKWKEKVWKYGYHLLHSVRKVKNGSVGLGRHLLFLGGCCCRNFFRKATKDLSVTCMAVGESKNLSQLVIPA